MIGNRLLLDPSMAVLEGLVREGRVQLEPDGPHYEVVAIDEGLGEPGLTIEVYEDLRHDDGRWYRHRVELTEEQHKHVAAEAWGWF